MTKGHSTRRLPVKGTTTEKAPRRLSEGQKISHAIIKTTGDLDKLMEQRNIPQIDIEEQLSEILAAELEDLEDTVEGENPDNDDYREEHDDEEDDYKDFDEFDTFDPFNTEERKPSRKPLYIAAFSFKERLPAVKFLQSPQYDTGDVLVKNALVERYKLFYEMASFIAQKQDSYFRKNDEENLENLNQQDIVEFLTNKGHKISKVHVSRMLDNLCFKIEGLGTVPAKFMIKRYGVKSRLTREEKLALTSEFLKTCDRGLNQLEKAKELVRFIEQKKGISIKLSNSKNEHDKYKQWKNLILQVENETK